MLKLNTVLTGVCTVFLALIGWLGKCIWDDVAMIKNLTAMQTVQMQTMSRELDDHESRIRQTEHEVTILQQSQREERRALSPKMSENKP